MIVYICNIESITNSNGESKIHVIRNTCSSSINKSIFSSNNIHGKLFM